METKLAELLPLREALLGGDLRPLFIAWLACCFEDDAKVPPVPAGLGKLTRPLKALADFYELPNKVIKAVARGASASPKAIDPKKLIQDWAAGQTKAELAKLVTDMLVGDPPVARSSVIAKINRSRGAQTWPTTPSSMKTFGELCQATGFRSIDA